MKQPYIPNTTFMVLVTIFFASLILTILTACGHMVKEDQADAYSDTNYLSVESILCSNAGTGLNGCYVQDGESIADKSLIIQGLYQGEVEIFSQSCGINIVERYGLHERKVIPLSRLYRKNTLRREDSCTFRIVLKPDVLKDTKVKMYPRLGRFFIEVLPAGVERFPAAFGDQISQSSSSSGDWLLTLPVKEDGKFQLAHCSGEPIQGEIVKGAAKIPGFKRDKDCKYQVALRTASKKYIWIYYRNVYLRNTDLLPEPRVTKEGNKLCVYANESITTFVSINNNWKNSSEICAEVSGISTIRTVTVKRNNTIFWR